MYYSFSVIIACEKKVETKDSDESNLRFPIKTSLDLMTVQLLECENGVLVFEIERCMDQVEHGHFSFMKIISTRYPDYKIVDIKRSTKKNDNQSPYIYNVILKKKEH
jgi:hypothetical protein